MSRWVHRKAEKEPRCFSIVASSPTPRGARLDAASAKLFARHTTRFFESIGIDLTVLAGLVGGVLVLALVQRWAWRIPRWLLLLPAWVGGISLPVYGFLPAGAWLPDAGRRRTGAN